MLKASEADISANTPDLKLKLCTQLEYEGKMMLNAFIAFVDGP